jgi:DNA-binding NarL/FixJ family response regulator
VTLTVVIVDDHAIVRAGLRALIDAQPDLSTVGEAGDGLAAVKLVSALQPDVVVVDVSMPELGGAPATERIRTASPSSAVVALTAHEEPGYVHAMLKAGAVGYVLKRAVAEDLVRAIRVVHGGGVYLDPSVAPKLVARRPGRVSGALVPAELSEREAEVLRMLGQGRALKEVAATLDVSVRTVETYRARAMEKLGLTSRADVVRYAMQRGWLDDG